MAIPTRKPSTPKPTLKLLGRATDRVWKEVKSDGDGTVLKPESLSDFLLEFINTTNLLVLAGSGTSSGEKVGGPSVGKLWQAAKGLTGFVEAIKAE